MNETDVKKDDNIIDLKSAGDAIRKKKEEEQPKPPFDRMSLLHRLREAKELYSLLSFCTKAPYVVCDPETYDDELMIFFDAETAQQEAKKLAEQRIPVSILRVEEPQKLSFFSNLFTMGINALLVKEGEESLGIQLGDLVKRRMPEEEDGKVWVENPELLLTTLYYAQEARRGRTPEANEDVRALQEEMLAHFRRGRYIFALEKESKNTPLVKINEELFHPLFTDIMEFRRFNREDRFLPVVITADKLPKQMAPNAKGIVLNPMSVNMVLNLNTRRGNAPAPGNAQTPAVDQTPAQPVSEAAAGEAGGTEAPEAAQKEQENKQ